MSANDLQVAQLISLAFVWQCDPAIMVRIRFWTVRFRQDIAGVSGMAVGSVVTRLGVKHKVLTRWIGGWKRVAARVFSEGIGQAAYRAVQIRRFCPRGIAGMSSPICCCHGVVEESYPARPLPVGSQDSPPSVYSPGKDSSRASMEKECC